MVGVIVKGFNYGLGSRVGREVLGRGVGIILVMFDFLWFKFLLLIFLKCFILRCYIGEFLD